ncbi:cytochrome P450 2J2 [Patagioenas fasciata monilis]|uniref:Cytochrome P450 2J2 n=1 Tax=Patagioenas fasciata monilis TaxID=372326 RepID=A0A1V4JXS7_PATFA|nr:cytochrome P450 2J2 [Patagioenas fasciata monilis]
MYMGNKIPRMCTISLLCMDLQTDYSECSQGKKTDVLCSWPEAQLHLPVNLAPSVLSCYSRCNTSIKSPPWMKIREFISQDGASVLASFGFSLGKGPQLFPLMGTYVDFKQPLHLALLKLISRYGNIFSVQFGSLTFVVINGYQMVREALVHQAEIFADRPNIPLLQEIFRGFGLISSNGHIWRQQRKFTLATLKSIAVSFEEKVQEESRYLVETIEEEKGQPFDPHYKINSAVSNIICSITFGNRFDYHDNRFQELLHSLAETLLLIGSFWGQLYNAFPSIMRWLPGPFRKIFRHWEKLEYFVKEVITKHKEDLDQSEAGDYIDYYLKEIEKFKDDTNSYFHEENLLCSTLDLFLTGTETTATAIRWALLYMAMYPHIQEKVQLEIDSVIGQSRQPTMADKENMPYTSAVLSEVLRMGNVVPLGVPRMSTSDTTLAGFHVPKGTTLMTSLTSIMFDKNVWETPDTFNPEHFLENGQYRRREAFLPFSAAVPARCLSGPVPGGVPGAP